jgi:GST-like protein
MTERERIIVDQWLMWQMGGVGPMAGQAHHFLKYAPDLDPPQVLPYAQDRYRNEVGRLYKVLDTQLEDNEFVAGDYSIADMAIYPWVVSHDKQGQDLADYPHVKHWFETIRHRPAVIRAYARGKEINSHPTVDEKSRSILFGQGRRKSSSS